MRSLYSSSSCSLSPGTNSKHVDLKLKKLVDVSPRRVTSPSSPSSTSSSSSPTVSSTSPLSPAEGLEVRTHPLQNTHCFISRHLSLSLLLMPPPLLWTPSKGHPINQVRLTLVVSRPTVCTPQSVGSLHVRPQFIPSCVYTILSKAVRHTLWNHNAQHVAVPLYWLWPFQMVNVCVWKGRMSLLHASVSCHVNIESTTSCRPVLTSV